MEVKHFLPEDKFDFCNAEEFPSTTYIKFTQKFQLLFKKI